MHAYAYLKWQKSPSHLLMGFSCSTHDVQSLGVAVIGTVIKHQTFLPGLPGIVWLCSFCHMCMCNFAISLCQCSCSVSIVLHSSLFLAVTSQDCVLVSFNRWAAMMLQCRWRGSDWGHCWISYLNSFTVWIVFFTTVKIVILLLWHQPCLALPYHVTGQTGS